MKVARFILISVLCVFTSSAIAQRYVGGDISLLTKYEEHCATYFDINGSPINSPLEFFKAKGMNAMRVRLFVDPSNASTADKGQGVCQDLPYVIALSKRIKAAGMALMLDFHYSDSWADPSKQWTPRGWSAMSDSELYTEIYNYTKDVLQQMVAAGATPDFIQTGNEISYGMLWGPQGTTNVRSCFINNNNNWSYFTTLLKQAGKACRKVCPQAKIIIHTERAAQSDVLKGFYDNMKTYGVDYDIIGLSYYPIFHGPLSDLNTALTMMETNYPDKNIMIVEVGYYHDWQPADVVYDLSSTFPITPVGQKAFTDSLIEMLNTHSKVNGLFWWWMEANEKGLGWNTKRVTDNWYNAGLFDNQTGKAEPALYSMKNFLGSTNNITSISEKSSGAQNIYTLSGARVNSAKNSGIYVSNRKKFIVK